MVKDYISSNEREQLLFISKLYDTQQNMIEEWAKRNTLTKEELKYLRASRTFLGKFFDSVLNRMNTKCLKTIQNSLRDATVYMVDKYAMDNYRKKKSASIEAGYEENKDYYGLVEAILYNNCKNCQKHCTECDFYTLFEEKAIPDMSYHQGNCRFSYPDIKKEENKGA